MAIHAVCFRPQSCRLVVALPLPSALAVPRRIERTKEITNETGSQNPYSSSARAMKKGVRRNSSCPYSSAPSSSASYLRSPSLSLHSQRSHSDALPWPSSSAPPPHIRGGEEAQNRPAAPRIGEEVPDLEPVLPSPGLLPSLRPQNLLLGLKYEQFLKTCSLAWVLYGRCDAEFYLFIHCSHATYLVHGETHNRFPSTVQPRPVSPRTGLSLTYNRTPPFTPFLLEYRDR